ncbi:MAG TPA: radical SAM family heme chaperone HemW [Gemmatimonadaceae bacterium]|nr:radical SAM family heme chaperone HemW [Gemmatimonadaceae bacterium]
MLPRHIYVHVPFCARRCSYCDFSIAVRKVVPADEYLGALGREMDVRFRRGERWEAETLYLGGGTPSLLGADGVRRLVGMVRERVALVEGAEVTVEANPDDVSVAAVEAWREAGVNRLSIGAQSFDPRVLAWMHRTHSADQIGAAVAAARAGGIGDVSLDLIFALPESLGRDWQRDIERTLELRPTHVSLYGLTVEPATPLGRWRDRGEIAEAPEERYEEEFLTAHELLEVAGFEHYEVSNYALPGKRARHNSSYWRRVPYAGLGPAAHSFDGLRRRWSIAAYAAWERTLREGSDPLGGEEVLSMEEEDAERVYLGLRTRDGLPLGPDLARHVQPWEAAGWALFDGSRVRLTAAGWLRLDALASSLTTAGSPF